MQKEIKTVEAQMIAVKIIRLLDGLSVGQANWVLDEACLLINSTHHVDIKSQAFTEAVEPLEKLSA